MSVSIILPSARPTHVADSIASLRASFGGVTEIIVVATYNQPDDVCGVEWQEFERSGPTRATAYGMQFVTGDYIFTCSDENRFRPGMLGRLLALAVSRDGSKPNTIYSPWWDTHPYCRYYGHEFPTFPLTHRTVIERLGCLVDPAYFAFYADPDLGMRAVTSGVTVLRIGQIDGHEIMARTWQEESIGERDPVHRSNVQDWFVHDEHLFRARWDHLGRFKTSGVKMADCKDCGQTIPEYADATQGYQSPEPAGPGSYGNPNAGLVVEQGTVRGVEWPVCKPCFDAAMERVSQLRGF